MRKPHFFKAYTHLGIHNLPYGNFIGASGVENAPDKIFSDKFLKTLGNPSVSNFRFSNPEKIKPLNLYQTILKESLKFEKYILGQTKENETVIIIGGDHSITYPSILSDINRFGNNIGVIHFDSHADFNLFKTSPSKNFHGMYLRIFFDRFDLSYFDKSVPEKIPLSNLIFVGDLELDKEESEFINRNKLTVISSVYMENENLKILNDLKKFVEKFNHIHISFDVDVFRRNIASATTTPSKNGFNKEPVFKMLDVIRKSKSITLDIAEVNPEKKGAEKTIQIAQEAILKLLN